MGITHLSGLQVAGVPIITSGGAPFFTGTWYFCDYANGNDGNTGASDNPLKTIVEAHNRMTAGKNDVAIIVGDGSTTATQRLEASLTWSKNACHLIGMTAPVLENQRARISTLTTATVNINPLMTISASGCYFGNFSFFQGVGQSATDEQLLEITGDRNYFGNVQFGGMGAAAGAARAGSYCILFTDGDENLFEHCSIGLETIQRTTANASVRVRTGSQRNQFRDCQFVMAAADTAPLAVDANASNALNGSTMTFTRCLFRNLLNISAAATPAVVFTVAADVNGTIYLYDCAANASNWSANTVLIQNSSGAANIADGGLVVAIS